MAPVNSQRRRFGPEDDHGSVRPRSGPSHAKTLIVDTTEFRHAWGDGMMQWRDTEIIPLYNQAGVAKLAFIANPHYPLPTVEAGATPAPDGPANFPTGWFKTREAAYQWLAT